VAADSRPGDLYDRLSHSVRETQYSFQPQGVSACLPCSDGGCHGPALPAAASRRAAARWLLLLWMAKAVQTSVYIGLLFDNVWWAAACKQPSTGPTRTRTRSCAAVAVAGAPPDARDERDAGHGAGAVQRMPGGQERGRESGSRRAAWLWQPCAVAVSGQPPPESHPTRAPAWPSRPWHSAACSPRSSAPGPPWTTPSSCGALTSGALGVVRWGWCAGGGAGQWQPIMGRPLPGPAAECSPRVAALLAAALTCPGTVASLLAAPGRQDIPIEYSGEEQAIVAVGLVRPRLGVFVDAIQHLLVLCTTTEVGVRVCVCVCVWCVWGAAHGQRSASHAAQLAARWFSGHAVPCRPLLSPCRLSAPCHSRLPCHPSLRLCCWACAARGVLPALGTSARRWRCRRCLSTRCPTTGWPW
jgi:hypothetical protein